VSELNALALLKSCAASLGLQRDQLEPKHLSAILTQARLTFDFFGIPPERRDQCLDQLRALSGAERTQARADDMVTMAVEDEQDIVRARLAGKALCQRLGFTEVGTTKVMTAISELARNMHNYAGRGVIHIRRMNAEKPCIQVIATDRGPGIPDVEKVLSASYRSKSGMGLGLRGTRAIMDYFDIFSRPGEGTIVTVRKNLS
jgi:serine/threonine-protein kinase RsbT